MAANVGELDVFGIQYEPFLNTLNTLMLCALKDIKDFNAADIPFENLSIGYVDDSKSVELTPKRVILRTTGSNTSTSGSESKIVKARAWGVKYSASLIHDIKPPGMTDSDYERLGVVVGDTNISSTGKVEVDKGKLILELKCSLNNETFSKYYFPYRLENGNLSVYHHTDLIRCKSFAICENYSRYSERYDEEMFAREVTLRFFDCCWPLDRPTYVIYPNAREHRFARLYRAFAGKTNSVYNWHDYEISQVYRYNFYNDEYEVGDVAYYKQCLKLLSEVTIQDVLKLLLFCDEIQYSHWPEICNGLLSKEASTYTSSSMKHRSEDQNAESLRQKVRVIAYKYESTGIERGIRAKPQKQDYNASFKLMCQDLLYAAKRLYPEYTEEVSYSILTVWYSNLRMERVSLSSTDQVPDGVRSNLYSF